LPASCIAMFSVVKVLNAGAKGARACGPILQQAC